MTINARGNCGDKEESGFLLTLFIPRYHTLVRKVN